MTQLRIAQVVAPIERVPAVAYGGTERVVDELVRELISRGHDVTTLATGDSEVPGHLAVTAPRALRPAGLPDEPMPWIIATVQDVIEQARRGAFDVVQLPVDG